MTRIEYLDETWNPVTGCSPISAGCRNCWARRMAARLRGRCGYSADDPFRVTLREDRLIQPLRWRKPRRIGVCFMGDLFHPDVPIYYIQQVFGAMVESRQHTYLVLTKRPDRMLEIQQRWLAWRCAARAANNCLQHIWLGVSVEDQQTADERIPILLQIPAAIRWVSYEPALGPVDFEPYLPRWKMAFYNRGGRGQAMPIKIREGLDWVVAGGESGPGARPADPDWFRRVRDQCREAGVPFFMKQMYRKQAIPKDLLIREVPGE